MIFVRFFSINEYDLYFKNIQKPLYCFLFEKAKTLTCVRKLQGFLKVGNLILTEMAAKQRMRLANEKHSKNITTRGNVPKSLVRYFLSVFDSDIQVDAFHMSLSLVCDYSAVTFTKSHMYHILSMIYIFQAMSCLVQHYELETG